MNVNGASALFAALSNPDRLIIIRALVEAGPKGLTAGALAERIGASPSRASFHLSALSDAGIIASERAARHLNYRVRFETLGALITFLMQDCCRGSADLRKCCRF